jgi:hypothetical protein
VVSEIYAETKGNPFFVEELFRHLCKEDRLYDASGGFRSELKIAELDVPHSVRLVVRRRLARLSQRTQETLWAAATIGRLFTFELLAASTHTNGLLEAIEEAEHAGLITSRVDATDFEFSHELVRQAVLSGLSSVRRAQLHLEVAAAIEGVYLDALEDYYSELAHHYRLGGNAAKAIDYLVQAASQANYSAPSQAVSEIRIALSLLSKLPASGERDRRELALQLWLNAALSRSKGEGSDEAGRSLLRARELCQHLEDQAQMFQVISELWGFYEQRGDFATSLEFALRARDLAQGLGDLNIASDVNQMLGEISFWTGDFAGAATHYAQTRRRTASDAAASRSLPSHSGMDFHLSSETVGALNDGFLGYLDRCRKRLANVVGHTRNRSDLHAAAFALTHAACGHLLAGHSFAAQSSAEEAMALSKEHGFEERLEISRCIRGIALADQGLLEEGIREICDGVAALRLSKCGIFDSWFYGALALAYGRAGRPQEGLATIERILATIEGVGGKAMYLAEIHRAQGELLLLHEGGKTTQAEKSYRAATDLARSQGARLLELRATTSLARFLRDTNRSDEAHAMLAEIYNWFAEGFDTADLKEAKALLDELS